MTHALSIRNPEPLKTASKATLSVEVDTQGVSPLFLVVPLGAGAGALMTQGEFKDKLEISVAKADGAGDEPDADAGSSDKQVDPAKPDRGTIRIMRSDASTPARFCILLEDFTTNAAAGSAELHLEDMNRTSLAKTTVTISGARPRIMSFVSTKYDALTGKEITLSWEISPAGGAKLWRLLDNKEILPEPGGKTAKVRAGADGFTRYRLDAMLGQEVTDSRVLTLFSYDHTQVKSSDSPGSDADLGLGRAEILGIYNHRNRLYAAIRDADPQKGTSIWLSDIGFDSESWRPLTVERNGKQIPIMIPAAAAARPGVVFDNKLYFMGGSSYDANLPGTEVGYFHFEANTWVDGDAVREETWPKDMPARMGHALLASPDDSQLWVVGGYNGDGGAMNDVWVYDKNTGKWARHQASWEPRCLFGATFAGTEKKQDGTVKKQELWIAGGFDSPGGYPTYDDIWHCDTSQAKLTWEKLKSPLRRGPNPRIKQYCGCALAALGDQIYAFAAYSDVGEGLTKTVIRISFANNQWLREDLSNVGSDWVTGALDCYRFDATVLGDGIFVRWLARAKEKDEKIHYLVCV